jgi:MICOS complex subunit MIC19
MGASQSRSDEKVFYNETPIQVFLLFSSQYPSTNKLDVYHQFSQQVVDQLQDNVSSTTTPPERQSNLDSHIRSRIQSELVRLREEEQDVREQIELALEKENLDRERAMAGEEQSEAVGAVKSSESLMGDLDEVQKKVEKYHARWNLEDYRLVKEQGEALVSCYR